MIGAGSGDHRAASAVEPLQPLAQVEEADVDREGTLVAADGGLALPLRLEGPPQPVEQRRSSRRRASGSDSMARLQHRLGDGELALLEERDPQRFGGAEPSLGRAQRLLELGDRFVEQAHLLERDAQIVVGLEVVGVDVRVDALLELLERSRWKSTCSSSLSGSPWSTRIRVSFSGSVLEDERAEIHEGIRLRGRRGLVGRDG